MNDPTFIPFLRPQYDKDELERLKATAFGQGSDARIAGVVLTDNPYDYGDIRSSYWTKGWCDVDGFWGKWVSGRWQIHPLAPLKPKR